MRVWCILMTHALIAIGGGANDFYILITIEQYDISLDLTCIRAFEFCLLYLLRDVCKGKRPNRYLEY